MVSDSPHHPTGLKSTASYDRLSKIWSRLIWTSIVFHTKYGDKADSRDDYFTLLKQRDESIDTLITIAASSIVSIQAKATALGCVEAFEDFKSHQDIAVSYWPMILLPSDPSLFPIEIEGACRRFLMASLACRLASSP